jgi:Lipopolysaccharide export system permease LptF/LptG
MSAAAGRFRRFFLRHCSAATMERLVDPILTDIEIESRTAAFRGQRWASRWIRATGAIALFKALALYGWARFWSIREWQVDDRRVLLRTLAYSTAATVATILLSMIPFVLRSPAERAQELAPYLVPQALPYALAVGPFVGLLYGLRGRVVSLRPQAAMMVVVVLCSIASFVALAWVVPAANQVFRVAVSRDVWIVKGAAEMTIGELSAAIGAANVIDGRATGLAAHYHLRLALAAAPIVLALWALILVPRLPNQRLVIGVVAIASCVAHYNLMWTGHGAVLRETLPPIAGAWLPTLVFVAAILLLARRTPNDEGRTAPSAVTP